jgi:hypothetical protein
MSECEGMRRWSVINSTLALLAAVTGQNSTTRLADVLVGDIPTVSFIWYSISVRSNRWFVWQVASKFHIDISTFLDTVFATTNTDWVCIWSFILFFLLKLVPI